MGGIMMDSHAMVVAIHATPSGQELAVATCQGPNPFGACPRLQEDGTVACAGRYLRVLNNGNGIDSWLWQVDAHACTCPLAAMGIG